MRHNFGTAIRRDINAQMLGKALAAPGIDQRYWCSLGTVCTIDPETGKMDPTDKLAIYCDSAGVDVDVELEPLGQPCTCKYAGVQCGDVTIMAPIRPGDIVLVECPDGDLFTPVITHIMQSRSKRQPSDGGKPIFDNNRLLIHAKNVPIDIRTAGGVHVLLEQNGTVTTTAKAIKQGSPNASQHAVLGDQYTTQWQSLLSGLQTYIGAMEPVDPTGGVQTLAFGRILAQLQAGGFLSAKVTLE